MPSPDEAPWLTTDANVADDNANLWHEAIDFYAKGQTLEALESLPRESDQQQYAIAMLWLELGESARAFDEFEKLSSRTKEPGLRIAAKYWQDQLEAFTGR